MGGAKISTIALTNARIWYGQYDLTCDLNQIGTDYGADVLDSTTFCVGSTRTRKVGLRTVKSTLAGFWQADSLSVPIKVDDQLFASVGSAGRVLTQSPEGVLGDPAYTFQGATAKYTPGGKVGDLLAFTVDVEAGLVTSPTPGGGPLVKGVLFLSDKTAGPTGVASPKTATGASAIYNLGATTATQWLYAVLHVTAPVTGTLPTLDVVVESAALVGFGSPTTRITFAQQVGSSAIWATPIAGPITDQFYRVSYTIAGTLPSFPFVVVVGIV